MATTGQLALHGPRSSKLFCKRGHLRTSRTIDENTKSCIICHKLNRKYEGYDKEYYQGHKAECNKRSNLSRLKKYGLTTEAYNALFVKQQGHCLGCGTHQSNLLKPLYVDHNHRTGQVRGLLCQKCNTLLGMAEDKISTLSKLIQYLSRSEAVKEIL